MTTSLDRPASAGDLTVSGGVGSVLSRCVGDVDTFRRSIWGRTALLTRATGTDFTDLFSASDVDTLMGPQALRAPFFRLVRDGSSIPTSRYTRSARAGDRTLTDLPDSSKIAALFAAGASIVLQALHRVHPELGAFCAELSAELGHQSQVNAYVTPPGAQGFSDHHDTHDVFVLQVDGAKHWTIREPVTELPVPAQPSSDIGAVRLAASPVVLDVTLHPGDALYLPRGYIHSATTSDRRSIHLTVGLLQATWFDVLGDAARTAYGHPWLRSALPLGDEPADVERFRAEAMEWLASVPAEQLADLVASRRRRAVPAEPVAVLDTERLLRELGAHTPLRPRRGVANSIEDTDDHVVIALPDKRITLPASVASAVRTVLSGQFTPQSLAAACSDVDGADALVLMRRLLREHVLVSAL